MDGPARPYPVPESIQRTVERYQALKRGLFNIPPELRPPIELFEMAAYSLTISATLEALRADLIDCFGHNKEKNE